MKVIAALRHHLTATVVVTVIAGIGIALALLLAPGPQRYLTGDPEAGTGHGKACVTVAGYFPGGLAGHRDGTGFCVPDKTPGQP